MKQTEKLLVDSLLQGDKRLFDEFINDYFPRLFRFALTRLNGDEDAAEEVAQRTLCLAIRKLDTFRGEAALFSWLCTFCRHEIYAYLKVENRHKGDLSFVEDHPEIQAALESLSMTASSAPEFSYDRREVIRLIQVTVDHLPTLYGDVLEWKYVHGKSVKDIAIILGRSIKATESVLLRARLAFQEGFVSIIGEDFLIDQTSST